MLGPKLSYPLFFFLFFFPYHLLFSPSFSSSLAFVTLIRGHTYSRHFSPAPTARAFIFIARIVQHFLPMLTRNQSCIHALLLIGAISSTVTWLGTRVIDVFTSPWNKAVSIVSMCFAKFLNFHVSKLTSKGCSQKEKKIYVQINTYLVPGTRYKPI